MIHIFFQRVLAQDQNIGYAKCTMAGRRFKTFCHGVQGFIAMSPQTFYKWFNAALICAAWNGENIGI